MVRLRLSSLNGKPWVLFWHNWIKNVLSLSCLPNPTTNSESTHPEFSRILQSIRLVFSRKRLDSYWPKFHENSDSLFWNWLLESVSKILTFKKNLKKPVKMRVRKEWRNKKSASASLCHQNYRILVFKIMTFQLPSTSDICKIIYYIYYLLSLLHFTGPAQQPKACYFWIFLSLSAIRYKFPAL